MTLYSTLLRLAGLTNREAAAFHGVRPPTVKFWTSGRNAVPEIAMNQIRDLLDHQREAAEQALELIEDAAEDGVVEIRFCADNHEARALGWPSAEAHWTVIAKVWEGAPCDLEIQLVPRGSAIASAAASDVLDLVAPRAEIHPAEEAVAIVIDGKRVTRFPLDRGYAVWSPFAGGGWHLWAEEIAGAQSWAAGLDAESPFLKGAVIVDCARPHLEHRRLDDKRRWRRDEV